MVPLGCAPLLFLKCLTSKVDRDNGFAAGCAALPRRKVVISDRAVLRFGLTEPLGRSPHRGRSPSGTAFYGGEAVSSLSY